MRFVDETSSVSDAREETYSSRDEFFPHVAVRARLGCLSEGFVPWHWHDDAELFYLESGSLCYRTPHGELWFPEGSAGLLAPRVLHSTVWHENDAPVQLIHLFDPKLVFGVQGGPMWRAYVDSLGNEVVRLPSEIAEVVCASFALDDENPRFAWELTRTLGDAWLSALDDAPTTRLRKAAADERPLRLMVAFVHEHIGETITIPDIAAAGSVSVRTCQRMFSENFRTPPSTYVAQVRMARAREMLARDDSSIADIAIACGYSTPSYFGRTFLREMGCTPGNWRKLSHE